MRPRYSAAEVAEAVGHGHPPTAQQAAVIEAPVRPLLVVAGAGSGKTETMAARVVWLVANGFVEPDQVLGLTFTRKAATELAERIAARLRRLVRAGLWQPSADDEGAEALGGTPTVSTYHSYAGRLVREHALRLGYEPESRLLSEAASWQHAAEAVARYDGPMDAVGYEESTVIAAVVALAGEMSEHLRSAADVGAHLDRVLAGCAAVPHSRATHPLAKVRETLAARRAVLPIVDAYLGLKRSHDAMDFADQMALAARLATSFPDIGRVERQRYRAVLLDEFQDTSEAQLALLAALFVASGEPVPVTAVGDPNQSIYGWRGASATTLARFPVAFDDGAPADVLPLSTSWRNDLAVLETANRTAAPLRDRATVPVEGLAPRPGAGPGHVVAVRLDSHLSEAAYIAGWMLQVRSRPDVTAAVLCRKRSQFAPVIDALEAAGVPYEVVGLGGLLLTPEVEDLVALLRVVQDPARGDALMRLLTGPMCRLGGADLDGLMTWARRRQQVSRQRADGEPGPRELAEDAVDNPSIVEALEDLPRPGWTGSDGQRVSARALERLAGLREVVRRLRALTSLSLADLVGEAERALGLDIEVLSRPDYSPAAARAHLDAFADVAAGFTTSAERPTLGAFLGWLDAALQEERGLDKGYVEAAPDAVQVLTVHAAKGLEWDCVAVPGLVEGTFPASEHPVTAKPVAGEWVVGEPNDSGWCSGLPGVPYPLRGDADGLPVFDWYNATDSQDLLARFEDFRAAGGAHALLEERRLAYVAFTRARRRLLLSAPVWTATKRPKVTSRFLTELVEDPDLALPRPQWAPMPDPADPLVNPVAERDLRASWPADPHAGRREVLVAAEAAVRWARENGGAPEPSDPHLREALMLLAERDAAPHRGADVSVEVPRHLSASAVVQLAADPGRFALQLRRPIPAPPALAARRGTAFHAWVEEHYARAPMVDITELPGSADEDAADDGLLPVMKAHFLASEWAGRRPEAIEIAIETVLDGFALRGRIDAVFRREDGGFTVVDWKTGTEPAGAEAGVRALQLAAYALAYSRLRGVPASEVDAAFYYAQSGTTVHPPLPGEEELLALLGTVPG